MATSPNFSWPEPDNTDLVKNGALAIRTAVDAIDSSMADLKGGTTGQVLTKASNTDMDFSWVADATGIPATIFDAKGDIIAATAADTASRLAVGTNGQVLTADSTAATGLKWATAAGGGSTTLLSTTTLSGTTTTVSSISQAYKHLYIEIYGILPSAFNPTINYQTNATGVNWNVTQAASATGVNYYNTSGTVGNSQNYGGNMAGANKGTMWIFDYTDATYQKNATFNHWWRNEGGSWIYFNGQMTTGHSTAVTSLSMVVSTGTFTSGTIKIYGVN